MDYLGLGPDDAYDDYDASVAQVRPERQRQQRAPQGRAPRMIAQEYDDYEEEYDEPLPEPRSKFPRSAAQRDDSSVQVRPSSNRSVPTVRPLSVSTVDAVTVRPTRYDQAKDIADLVKSGQPVIMNIASADEETARRLIDFVSGLVYGLEGQIEKVAPGAFLIKPSGVRVSRS
jgi:cell division inhibitor SepF